MRLSPDLSYGSVGDRGDHDHYCIKITMFRIYNLEINGRLPGCIAAV